MSFTITRAQNLSFHFDLVYIIFTFSSTRGIASFLLFSLPPSLFPLPPFFLSFFYLFIFKNRGGKRVRTAAKNFLVWFQSILSRISQNVKCLGIQLELSVMCEEIGKYKRPQLLSLLGWVLLTMPGAALLVPGCVAYPDASLLPSCPCQKEVLCDVPSTQAPAHDLPQQQPLIPFSLKEFRITQLRFFFLTVYLLEFKSVFSAAYRHSV